MICVGLSTVDLGNIESFLCGAIVVLFVGLCMLVGGRHRAKKTGR